MCLEVVLSSYTSVRDASDHEIGSLKLSKNCVFCVYEKSDDGVLEMEIKDITKYRQNAVLVCTQKRGQPPNAMDMAGS